MNYLSIGSEINLVCYSSRTENIVFRIVLVTFILMFTLLWFELSYVYFVIIAGTVASIIYVLSVPSMVMTEVDVETGGTIVEVINEITKKTQKIQILKKQLESVELVWFRSAYARRVVGTEVVLRYSGGQ